MDKRELRDFKVRSSSSTSLCSQLRSLRSATVGLTCTSALPPPPQAGKIKNLHVKASVADAANVKYVGGKAARQRAKLAAGDAKGAASLQKQAEEQVEET